LFYNSLSEVEQQMLIDILRFEMSVLQPHIQKNMLVQLNKISHDIAVRVGEAIDLEAPAPDETYYHDNTTARMSTYGENLPTIAALHVGILAASNSEKSISQAKDLKAALKDCRVFVTIVGDKTVDGVDKALSAIDATGFDGIIVTDGTSAYFDRQTKSTFFPPGRPTQIVVDGYYWGKPLAFLGEGKDAIKAAGIETSPGVYEGDNVASVIEDMKEGLAIFKFLDRVALDKAKGE
jgi:catalase